MQQKTSTPSRARAITSAAVLACTLASGALAQDIMLYGIARDFQEDHPDFGVSPSLGFRHTAGNVSLELSDRRRPVFTGRGFEVASQWRDMDARPIAPHLYEDNNEGVVRVRTNPVVDNTAIMDTYDADLGHYDDQTPGPEPLVVVDAEIPVVPTPDALPANQGDITLTNGDTTEFTSNVHCDNFTVRNSHRVRIVGDVTVYSTGNFELVQLGSVLDLAPDSTLTVYVEGDFSMRNSSVLNASGDPSLVTIYAMGSNVLVEQSAQLSARVIAPNANMHVSNTGEFYGWYRGESLSLDNSAGFHIEGPPVLSPCGEYYLDAQGAAGLASAGDIQSAQSFSQWFRDVYGVNASMRHPITLTADGSGFYEYATVDFRPLEDKLYGFGTGENNSYFTYQISAEFMYRACGNQVIELAGSDDIWVYVDGKLLIDLGGLGANQPQVGEVDRLGLTDGQQYTLTIFYAHRSNSTPHLAIRTNLDFTASLESAGVPVHAGWD